MNKKYLIKQTLHLDTNHPNFKKPLVLTHALGKAKEFYLHNNFEYKDEDYHIILRRGMKTDGASNARIFWNVIPPIAGKYLEAAVIHDGLYRSNAVPRKEADDIFLRVMERLGVSWWKRKVIYRAVRLLGYWSYKNPKTKTSFYSQFVIVKKLNKEEKK